MTKPESYAEARVELLGAMLKYKDPAAIETARSRSNLLWESMSRDERREAGELYFKGVDHFWATKRR